jgi:hypothetical protein
MTDEESIPTQPRSYFARKLAADPVLAARCREIEADLRKLAQPDVQAAIRSQQLGPLDYGIIINARAENM